MRTIFTAFLFLITLSLHSQEPIWLNQIGGSSNQDISDQYFANDIYVVGDFTGSIDFGNNLVATSQGGSDIYWAKYNTQGALLDLGIVATSFSENAEAIHVDASGNIYIAGTQFDFEGPNLYLVKLGSNGDFIWSVKEIILNNGFGAIQGIGTDNLGNVYITGNYSGRAFFNDGAPDNIILESLAGSSDIFVANYSSQGAVQWVISQGGTSDDVGTDIYVDGNGNSFVAGWFRNTASIAGNVFSSPGDNEMFVARYSDNGSAIWSNTNGNQSEDLISTIEVDNSGIVHVAGSRTIANSPFNGFVSRFNNSNGGLINTINIPGIDLLNMSPVNSSGEFAIVGLSSNVKLKVAKINNSSVEWEFASEGIGTGRGRGVDLAPDGTIYTSGVFTNEFTVGSETLNSSGSQDAFIGQFSPPGYCFSNATSADFGAITNVELNGISRGSNNCTTYTDFTSDELQVYPNLPVSFSVTLGSCSGNFTKAFKIFADWNADEDFDDIGEEVYTSSAVSNGVVTGTFNTPSNISEGSSGRLRIVCINILNGDPSQDEPSDILPCGIYFAGETEDYGLLMNNFSPPEILSFSPSNGFIGGPVTISGSNFDPFTLTSLRFNETPGVNIQIINENTIIASPNIGASTGEISLSTYDGGTITSSEGYIINCAEEESDVENIDLPNSWFGFNGDNDIGLSRVDLEGPNNSSFCYFMNNFAYNAPEELDGLIIANICTSGLADLNLSFDYAYTYFQDGSIESTDSLLVINLETDEIIWIRGGADLATRPPLNTSFVPQLDEWTTQNIDLSSLIANGETEITLLLLNKNGFGNNLFLDNITIQETPALFIEGIEFTGTTSNNKTILDWRTIGEFENSHFILEKSYDSSTFNFLSRIESIGNGNHVYEYVDNTLRPGRSFYRLSSISYDGVQAFYNIISLISLEEEKLYSVYPNPALSNFFLENSTMSETTFKIYTSTNQLVHEGVVLPNTRKEVRSQFPKGLYFVEFIGDYGAKSVKKIVIN